MYVRNSAAMHTKKREEEITREDILRPYFRFIVYCKGAFVLLQPLQFSINLKSPLQHFAGSVYYMNVRTKFHGRREKRRNYQRREDILRPYFRFKV